MNTPTPAELVLREHAELDDQVARLRQLLTEEFDWLELDKVLSKLEQSLVHHFELEETGGYLTDLLEVAPYHKREIDRLYEEHIRMRNDLRSARHLIIDGGAADELRKLLSDWISLFSDHERRENLLSMDVFNTDLGGGD